MTSLPNKKFRALVPKLREKGFYPAQDQRPISWPEYTLTQIHDAKDTLLFIREAVDRAIPEPISGRVGRPLTDPAVLAKAVLVCEFLGLPERQAQGWLEIIGPFIGIDRPLDDRVIGEAYHRPEVAQILKQVFDANKTSDRILSGDGTGLETSRKQNYESTKKSSGYMTSIVDSREIVQAFDISGKQECKAMHQLIEEVEGDSLRLDAGFVDRKLTSKIAELGMEPFVFPKKNLKLNGRPAWKNMYSKLYHDVIIWLIAYHQRSHTESFHSAFKRRFGILTKRIWTAQLTQTTARIILHNNRKLSYFNQLANAS